MRIRLWFQSPDYKSILTKVIDAVFSKSNMDRWMQETADDIKKRTRLGYGVEKDLTAKKKLRELQSKKYIDFRKADPYSELSPDTRPARSNLTYTGPSKAKYHGEIWLVDSRKPTKNQKRSFTNNDLADWNAKKGRNFMAVSDLEYKRLTQKIEKVLTEQLRQAFSKK